MGLVVAEMGWAGCLGLVSAVLLTWLVAVVVMLRLFDDAPMSGARPGGRRPAVKRGEEQRHDRAPLWTSARL
jgi:hypothetical protein